MATFSVRMDNDTKRDFDAFCESVGLTVSAAFNIFAKKVVRENRIPFEISGNDPFYSDENQKRLYKSLMEAKEGKMSVHELIEVD